MAKTVYSLLLIVLYVNIAQINGQGADCIPDPVEGIHLFTDGTLSWELPSNNSCPISRYLVFIFEGTEERFYTTEERTLNVSFLPICFDVRITIYAVSTNNINGLMHMFFGKTPAPPDLDLNLAYFRLSPLPNNSIRLEWSLEPQWARCLYEYRIVSYNEDDDEATSIYTSFTSEIRSNLIPCTSYVFTATALYNLETEGGVSVIRYRSPSAKISAPVLNRLSVASTSASLTWILPNSSLNRCPVNALVVDGSPNFNISYPINGQNQITRPPVDVRLTNLLPNTMYVLQVYANNTAGFSDPFIIGLQTLQSN